jgi:hypothetical protein
MKTSTIVKISAAIFLCIIFLALIGKKTRNRVENFKNTNSNQSYGNANPDESRSMNINGSGYPIIDEDDNHLSNLNLDERHTLSTNNFCTISKKTNDDRDMAIQKEALDAKQQLDAYLKQKLATKEAYEQNSNPPGDPCTYLRFPGILS